MAVLLQKPYTEAVECGDAAQILIRKTLPDPLFHLCGGLIGKRYTKNVCGGDPQHLHQVQIPGRQCPGLAGTGSGHHTDKALRGCGRLQLLRIQIL